MTESSGRADMQQEWRHAMWSRFQRIAGRNGELLAWLAVCGFLFFYSPVLRAQESESNATAKKDENATKDIEKLGPAELEQLVIRIALYPDLLVAQILPASTYPLEVVKASRFLDENNGKVDEETIKSADWDPSIGALMHYPDVLKMMNDDLDWITALGDAVVAQQDDVMAAIQQVRIKAQDAGNLESNDKIVIVRETRYITIAPANPQVIYVPTYNPSVIYVYRSSPDPVVTFGVGVAVGAWLAYGCNWHSGHVKINVKSYHGYWGRYRPGWGAHPRWRHDAGRRAAYASLAHCACRGSLPRAARQPPLLPEGGDPPRTPPKRNCRWTS